MTSKLLVGPATVFTNTNDSPVIANAGVLCEGTRIAKVGSWAELESYTKEAQWLGADGKLVLPGLINAHHHLYSTSARAMPIPPRKALELSGDSRRNLVASRPRIGHRGRASGSLSSIARWPSMGHDHNR